MSAYPQSVQFQGPAIVTMRWADFKGAVKAKNLQVQYVALADSYTVFAFDGPLTLVCAPLVLAVASGGFPFDPSYPQAQNDADTAEFEATTKSAANGSIESRALDGRVVVRTTVASQTKNSSLKVFAFVPGNAASLTNSDANFNRLSDVTMTCYDGAGAETTDPSVAVKSVLDWEPPYDYEAVGGMVDVPAGIAGGTTGLWWLSCVGLPDIPAVYGGSVNFVNAINIEAVRAPTIVTDGRATQYLTYSAAHHTNKLRWIVLHPPGSSAIFQVYVETFT